MAEEKIGFWKKGQSGASVNGADRFSPVSGSLMSFASHSASKALLFALVIVFLANLSFAASLSCSVKTSCEVGETDVLHMSDLDNGHAEFANQSDYSYKICCKDADESVTIGTDSGTPFLHLSEVTNAQVEQATESHYPMSALMSVSDPDLAISCGYQSGSCTSYDTCVASISDSTNAQVGNCSAYAKKVCCSIQTNPTTGCSVINSSGTFTQTANLFGAPNDASPLNNYSCVKINASNVVYDCNGYSITGSLDSPSNLTYGIQVGCNVDNVLIRNCPSISNYSYGIKICDSTSLTIKNVKTSGNSIDGIYSDPSSDVSINDSESTDNGNIGINIKDTDFVSIFNTLVKDNVNEGIYIENSESQYLYQVDSESNGKSLTAVNVSNLMIDYLSSSGNTQGAAFIGTDVDMIGGTIEAGVVFDGTGNAMSVSLTGTEFTSESPTHGTQTAILTLTDAAVNEEYTVFGNEMQGAMPEGFMGVPSYGFVNITPLSGSPMIDLIQWEGINPDADIFRCTGGACTKMNATKGRNTLTLTNIDSFSNWGPLINVTFNLTNVTYQGIGRANVTIHGQTRWSGMNASNVTTEGGNVTDLGINMTSVTDRWAAFYGNVTGALALKEAGLPAYAVYEWTWNVSDNGGFVCVSENPALNFLTIDGATASEIDTAWGFGTVSDNAINTFNNGSCSVSLAMSTATATNRAKTGDGYAGDPFATCPLKSPSGTFIAPGDYLKFAFCAPIQGPSGYNWKAEPINFEIIVPTAAGAYTETYYFFAQLD